MRAASDTFAEALTAWMPSTDTSPSAISRAACVRDRASPLSARAASRRAKPSGTGRRVAALKLLGELVVQLREGLRPALERLVFDNAQTRQQRVVFCVSHDSIPPHRECEDQAPGRSMRRASRSGPVTSTAKMLSPAAHTAAVAALIRSV